MNMKFSVNNKAGREREREGEREGERERERGERDKIKG